MPIDFTPRRFWHFTRRNPIRSSRIFMVLCAMALSACSATPKPPPGLDPEAVATLYLRAVINADPHAWWPLTEYRGSLNNLRSIYVFPGLHPDDRFDAPWGWNSHGDETQFRLANARAIKRSECRTTGGHTLLEDYSRYGWNVVSVPIACRIVDFVNVTGLTPYMSGTRSQIWAFFPMQVQPTAAMHDEAARKLTAAVPTREVFGYIRLKSEDGNSWDINENSMSHQFLLTYYRVFKGDDIALH